MLDCSSWLGQEVYLSDEDIAEIMLHGQEWTIYSDNTIHYQTVYETTNLLRKIEDTDDGILAEAVVAIVLEDHFPMFKLLPGDQVNIVMVNENGTRTQPQFPPRTLL